MSRRLALLALAAVAALVLAACGDEPVAEPDAPAESPTPEETPTEVADPEPEPSPTSTPTPTEEHEPDGADAVTVFYARDHDSGVWVEPEVVELDEPTVAVARAAMEALVAGDGEEPGRITLAGEDAEVLDVHRDDDLLIVDFNERLVPEAGLGAAYEGALVQQIAHTGTQFDGVEAVQILIEGSETESLAGHVDTSGPVEPDPFALSPITFDSHGSGDEVPVGTVTVGGQACTFEATIELELEAPDGSLVEETFTTATSGCPERGEWAHDFALPEAGTWTIRAIEPDPSGGEGRPPFEVELALEAVGG